MIVTEIQIQIQRSSCGRLTNTWEGSQSPLLSTVATLISYTTCWYPGSQHQASLDAFYTLLLWWFITNCFGGISWISCTICWFLITSGPHPTPTPPMNCQFVWFEYAAKGWFINPQYPLQLLLPCWGISPWPWILISVLSNNWIPIQIEGNWYRDDTRISDTVWTKQ